MGEEARSSSSLSLDHCPLSFALTISQQTTKTRKKITVVLPVISTSYRKIS